MHTGSSSITSPHHGTTMQDKGEATLRFATNYACNHYSHSTQARYSVPTHHSARLWHGKRARDWKSMAYMSESPLEASSKAINTPAAGKRLLVLPCCLHHYLLLLPCYCYCYCFLMLMPALMTSSTSSSCDAMTGALMMIWRLTL